MQNEKEQEMKSPANPTEASAGSQRDLVHSLEILDTEFSSRPIGEDAPYSSTSQSACDSPCHHLFSRHRASHHTHPVPFFFFFCSPEVKRSGPWRDERELERSSVITLCSPPLAILQSWTTRDLWPLTATKERNGFSWLTSFPCYNQISLHSTCRNIHAFSLSAISPAYRMNAQSLHFPGIYFFYFSKIKGSVRSICRCFYVE